MPTSKLPGPPRASELDFRLNSDVAIKMVLQNDLENERWCDVAGNYYTRNFVARFDYQKSAQVLVKVEKAGKKLYPHTVGTTEKCNFCMERIDDGLSKGLKPGIDRDATPACVNTCPARALTFGDLDDPDSEVRRLIREKKGFQLHPEYDTDPSLYYIDDGRRGV